MTTERIEGAPGTWSHCGSRKNHAPHSHTVVMNEGPYPNIVCLGWPGDISEPSTISSERDVMKAKIAELEQENNRLRLIVAEAYIKICAPR